jgi:hypothetical protein
MHEIWRLFTLNLFQEIIKKPYSGHFQSPGFMSRFTTVLPGLTGLLWLLRTSPDFQLLLSILSNRSSGGLFVSVDSGSFSNTVSPLAAAAAASLSFLSLSF